MNSLKTPIWNNQFATLLLDSMAEGVFTLDPDGTITSWNPAMKKITGYDANEAIGKTCSMMQFNQCYKRSCPEDVHQCKIFLKGRVDSKECKLVHKNGQMVTVLKNACVVKDSSGEVVGVVETITDLTELIEFREKTKEAGLKLAETHQFSNIIGKSRIMRDVYRAITAAGKTDTTILIQGESGTGKELVAGAIHYNSDRANGPLVTVNCSALSESLLESELFGHVKGAFTGAHQDRKGRFEEAAGGTIFLDEIGEISPFIQLKLLRTIQERQIERVGESLKRETDFRVITATNKDLFALVREGLFREDLYYRLKVYPIQLPPLRNRKEDIPILTSHFIQLFNTKTGKQIAGASSEAFKALMAYEWPGNVRELKNAIEHAFVVCHGSQIESADLPIEIFRINDSFSSVQMRNKTESTTRIKLTKAELTAVLQSCAWNKAEAGRRLGLSRVSIWKYMKKWDVPLDGKSEME
jgi:PAS domain S-box-containing protein